LGIAFELNLIYYNTSMEAAINCVFHLRTSESIKLRGLVEVLTPVLVEGGLSFTATGVSVRGLNTILLADVVLESDKLDEYHCAVDTQVSIAYETLASCLASAGQGEDVVIQATRASLDSAVPYISVFLVGDAHTFQFKVTLLALEVERLEIPDHRFAVSVRVAAPAFARVLRACDRRGTAVQVVTRVKDDKNYLIVFCEGDDADLVYSVQYEPSDASVDQECLKLDRYNLRYLSLACKATGLSNDVTLYLAHDFVLALRYSIGGIGTITFCLAPLGEKATSVPDIGAMPVRMHRPSPDDAADAPAMPNDADGAPEAVASPVKIRRKRKRRAKAADAPCFSSTNMPANDREWTVNDLGKIGSMTKDLCI
jgi:hypothetical protein